MAQSPLHLQQREGSEMEPSEELVVRFSRLKLLLPFIPLVLLVGISVAWNPDAWRNGPVWQYVVFGVVIVVLLVGCILLPRRYYLRLSPTGLTAGYLTGERSYRWDEIKNIRLTSRKVNDLSGVNLVVFDLAEDSPQRTGLVRATSRVNRYDVSILAIFDLSGEELVEVLTEWQKKYSRAGGR
jgi:Bacterial PH domain